MHAQKLPARTGRLWLREAYLLYRKNPPLLTSAAMAYLLVGVGVSFVPVLGPYLMPLIQPTLAAMLANVCAIVARGQKPERELLVTGVREQQKPLFQLGVVQLGLSAFLLLIAKVLESLLGIDESPDTVTVREMLYVLVPLFLLMLPLFMAVWFAPILVAWHRLSPVKALFFSFVSVWRNLRTFAVYFINVFLVLMASGLVVTVLSSFAPGAHDAFASVIQFILLMVLMPMLLAGVFVSYRDVFEHPAEKAAA